MAVILLTPYDGYSSATFSMASSSAAESVLLRRFLLLLITGCLGRGVISWGRPSISHDSAMIALLRLFGSYMINF